METELKPSKAGKSQRTTLVLGAMTALFSALAALMLADLWGRPPVRSSIEPVDRTFLETTPWRSSYADLVRAKEDLSNFDCYACHEKDKPPVLQLDANNILIIPEEHQDIVMAHGSHNRNNLCYNCHNEANLVTLHIRDGKDLSFSESAHLCGSCHGPTYRDWEAGAHGRTSGHWDRKLGPIERLSCTNCHDPHSPRIPTRVPAPGPHGLHDSPAPAVHAATTP